MNQIYIGESTKFNNQANTFFIAFEQAEKYLQILRADYFNKVTVSLPNNINDKQLRFMMHLSRILKQKVCICSLCREKFSYKINWKAIKIKYLQIQRINLGCFHTKILRIINSLVK